MDRLIHIGAWGKCASKSISAGALNATVQYSNQTGLGHAKRMYLPRNQFFSLMEIRYNFSSYQKTLAYLFIKKLLSWINSDSQLLRCAPIDL